MARRVSLSQLQAQLRQAQQKQKQAIDHYNRQVQQHNQKQKQAVDRYNQQVEQHNRKQKQALDRYNQAVRAHNARVQENRRRFTQHMNAISRARVAPQLVTYRSSVASMHRAYIALEHRYENTTALPEEHRFLDLSEREAANSIALGNRLLLEESEFEDDLRDVAESDLGGRLRQVSVDLDDRWRGAVFSLNPQNPDAARHFCTSAREIFTGILAVKAPDELVLAAMPNCDVTDQGNPTRRTKIRYLLGRQGMDNERASEFVEQDIQNIVELFQVFNDGTHGSAGTFSNRELHAIRRRVEDGITFLVEIVLGY